MSEGINAQQLAEIRHEIEQINNLLKYLEPKTKQLANSIRQEITLLTNVLTFTRRMRLPDEVDAAIRKIQAIIGLLMQLRVAAIAAQAAMGPIGWALAIVSAAGVAVSVASFSMEISSH